MLFFYYSLLLFLSFIYIILSFLSLEVMKSCFYLCMSVLFILPFFSLGVNGLYPYFILLIFLSGVLGLITYICSLHMLGEKFNLFLLVFICSVVFGLFFFVYIDYDIFVEDMVYVYDNADFFLVNWLIFILLLFLGFLSFNFFNKGCLRGI